MDYPLSKAVALRLVGGKFADRAGSTKGSVIPAEDWANDITDEIIAAQAAAGIAAVENQNDQLAEAIRILARGGALGFRVKPQAPASLSVNIEAGSFFDRSTGLLVSVPATNAGPIVAPAGNPRNDIVYIDALTGATGIQAGVENAVPVDPALPFNKLPLSRIGAYVGMAEIVAADITDMRYLGTAGITASTVVTEAKFKPADQSVVSSVVPVNDDDLWAPLAANERVFFELMVFFEGGATGDYRYTFTVPAGATIQFSHTQDINKQAETASGQTHVRGAIGGAVMVLHVRGSVVNGVTPGNLQFQFAQSVSEVTPSTTRAGSVLEVTRGFA